MRKYGNYKLIKNDRYQLTLSLGYNANGKRIRKCKTITAKNEKEAEFELSKFYLEYNNVIIRNKVTKEKRKKLKNELNLFCNIHCYKDICRDKECFAYKFYIFEYNRILEDYEHGGERI